MSVSQSHQQGERSVYTNCGRHQHGYRTKDPTWSSRNFVHIIQNVFVHLCYTRQLDGCKQWMYKKSNAKISDCQTSKEKFRWKINRRHFMKYNCLVMRWWKEKCAKLKKGMEVWLLGIPWLLGFVQFVCEVFISSDVRRLAKNAWSIIYLNPGIKIKRYERWSKFFYGLVNLCPIFQVNFVKKSYRHVDF